MDDFVPFASRTYGILFVVLIFARAMDFFSTWVATPNLVLEGNPIAKKLGWKYGIPVNLGMCFGFAFWPLPAIVISTTSLLVAARNFQSAWLMRSVGEHAYREWYLDRLTETPITLYLLCLAGNTVLTAVVGAGLVWFSVAGTTMLVIPLGVGLGIIAYAGAVLFFTLLGTWRLRRSGWNNRLATNGTETLPTKKRGTEEVCAARSWEQT